MDYNWDNSARETFLDSFDEPSPSSPTIRRQDSDHFMANADLLDIETDNDDDDDDDFCLDLTATPQNNDTRATDSASTNGTPPFESDTTPANDPLDWLNDDSISEEQLVAMGIDVAEIRAQKEIERRLEDEARQLAFAQRLQEEINSGVAEASLSLSSTQPTTMAAAPSSPSQSNGKQPERHLPSYIERRYPEPSSSSSTANKRPKLEHSTLDNNNNHEAAESSSSALIRAPYQVYTIDSDDDLVDLTMDNNDGGSNTNNAISLLDDNYPSGYFYDLDEDDNYNNFDSDDDPDEDDRILPGGLTAEAIYQQLQVIRQRQDARDRYGIMMNPLAGTHFEHTALPYRFAGVPQPNASRSAKRPQQPPPPGFEKWTPQQAEDELRQLLTSINDEEPPPPESRVGTPEGLTINLLEHQKVGFQWMSRQEVSTNKGGLLADDMGLGKTIQAMALIVSRRCQDAAELPDPMSISIRSSKRRMDPFKVKTTLVICPVSLMEQWAQEIKYKSENLSVHIHHGSRKFTSPYEVANFDVVITSYHTIAAEYPEDSSGGYTVFNPLIFHRVILDEAHSIKNRRTRSAKACYRIEATHRWCLTATPIQNKLEELFSLIYFLRIRPYCDWTTFRDEIVRPMKNGYAKRVLRKVQVILKAIALRRSKKAEIDGRPILNLPERNIHFTHVDFPPEERQFYDYVDSNVQARFDHYVQTDTVMQNYSSVLVLLLRLRQACLHHSLTKVEKSLVKSDEDRQTEIAEGLDQKVVERLINDKEQFDSAECPICMDTADEPRINSDCGHILCRECLSAFMNSSDNYGSAKTCPQCRGVLIMERIISVSIFIKVHLPELALGKEKEQVAKVEDAEDVKPKPDFDSSQKIDTMLEILLKSREDSRGGDKTIIFSQFTTMLDVMERPLQVNGFKFGRYDGSLSLNERTRVLEQFHNDPTMEVLLVSTKCGSLGLNLTVANRVILMDVWWNPALENQAIDRVHRIGQTKDVEVHRLFINNTVEDRILELQKKKQQIADGALGEGGAEKLGRLDLQDMLYLFRGGPVPGGNSSLPGTSL